MSLAANPEERSEVAGCWRLCQCRERGWMREGKEGEVEEKRRDGATTRPSAAEGGPKGRKDRPTQYFLSALRCVCSLVKRCVAFGIYRASSHLKLICLLAAGSYPGGLHSQEVSLWRRTAEAEWRRPEGCTEGGWEGEKEAERDRSGLPRARWSCWSQWSIVSESHCMDK